MRLSHDACQAHSGAKGVAIQAVIVHASLRAVGPCGRSELRDVGWEWPLRPTTVDILINTRLADRMDAFDWGDELRTLTGRRVNLRWLTHEDGPDRFTVFGDPDVIRFWSSPPLNDVAGATALIDEIQGLFRARRLYQWGVCSRETGNVFGTCTLFNIDPAHRRAEIVLQLRARLGDRAWPPKRSSCSSDSPSVPSACIVLRRIRILRMFAPCVSSNGRDSSRRDTSASDGITLEGFTMPSFSGSLRTNGEARRDCRETQHGVEGGRALRARHFNAVIVSQIGKLG